MYPDTPTPTTTNNRKRTGLIVIGVIVAIVVVLVLFILTSGSGQPKPEAVTDTTSTTQTAPPTPPATDPNKVTIDYLTSYGATSQQIDALQQAMFKFAQSKSLDIKTLVIDRDSIKHTLPQGSQPYHVYTFTAHLGDASYNAKMEAVSVLRARLYIIDPSTQQQIFDSGVINSTAVGS